MIRSPAVLDRGRVRFPALGKWLLREGSGPSSRRGSLHHSPNSRQGEYVVRVQGGRKKRVQSCFLLKKEEPVFRCPLGGASPQPYEILSRYPEGGRRGVAPSRGKGQVTAAREELREKGEKRDDPRSLKEKEMQPPISFSPTGRRKTKGRGRASGDINLIRGKKRKMGPSNTGKEEVRLPQLFAPKKTALRNSCMLGKDLRIAGRTT